MGADYTWLKKKGNSADVGVSGSLLENTRSRKQALLLRTSAGDNHLRGRCLMKFKTKRAVTVAVLHDAAAVAQPLWLLERFKKQELVTIRLHRDQSAKVEGGNSGGAPSNAFGFLGGVVTGLFEDQGNDGQIAAYNLFTCSYAAGSTVTLGGNSSGNCNDQGSDINMYIALVVAQDTADAASGSFGTLEGEGTSEDGKTCRWAQGENGMALLYSKKNNLVVGMPSSSDFANPSRALSAQSASVGDPLAAVTSALTGVGDLFGGQLSSAGTKSSLSSSRKSAATTSRPKILQPHEYATSEVLNMPTTERRPTTASRSASGKDSWSCA